MKPGNLVKILRFDKLLMLGVYLGPGHHYDVRVEPYMFRFLSTDGKIYDFDLGTVLVYSAEVLQ